MSRLLQRHPVLAGEHGEHAVDGECGRRVDAADLALRDRRLHGRRVRDALDVVLVRVLRLAGDLLAPLDAVERRADRTRQRRAHPASSASVRTSTLRASGTL